MGKIRLTHRNELSPLELANLYIESARNSNNPQYALELCRQAEAALSRMPKATKISLTSPLSSTDKSLRDGIAAAYQDIGEIQKSLGENEEAQANYKMAEKWQHVKGTDKSSAGSSRTSDKKNINSIHSALAPVMAFVAAPHLTSLNPSGPQDNNLIHIPPRIFDHDMASPTDKYVLPNTGERLTSTPQLVYCLGLLSTPSSTEEQLNEVERAWSQAKADDQDEKERLHILAKDLTKAFINDELKSPSTVAEVVCLAPVLDQDHFRSLLKDLINDIDQATLLEVYLLEGLARLIQSASPEYLETDDLVKILRVLGNRLKDTHQQSTEHVRKLTLAVSHVLDAMADCQVKDLSREDLHEPLSDYLNKLKSSPDPYLVYQAAYAFQALQCIPDNESPLQATLRRTLNVARGVVGIAGAVKVLDVDRFILGLTHLHDGLADVYQVTKSGYRGTKALLKSGKDLLDCLKHSLSFAKKRAWYAALRGIDNSIRQRQLVKVKRLIYEAPCRRDLAFQWGVCQRLGEIAANPTWDMDTRRSAVDFLGEIYKNDVAWGEQAMTKQWILNILEQLGSQPGSVLECAEITLNELSRDGDVAKQGLYQASRAEPQRQCLFSVAPSNISSVLLDRVQNKPDIEGGLRLLKQRRLQERTDAVYIPPQAKPSLQSPDDVLFPLMEKVKDLLSSDRKVMLILGDSGAGKSTFDRALECDLWNEYKKTEGRIPLYINLPSIDKPEQDLIAKHLRKADFTDAQILELKNYRTFILICDGYDESQQTHNLYTTNRLNLPGEWRAQMVISCRSEYVGREYRDRFQPSDRNLPSKPDEFQEAVIAPFTMDQVRDYIAQYVVAKSPIWKATEYLDALEQIPNVRDLVKNPFMLTLALEALPSMVNPQRELTAMQVTRIALYDHFVEQWLERNKKRLVEKSLSDNDRKAFENLCGEGFIHNGMSFLKDLAVAIYENQGGYPVVEYSHFRDQKTWKGSFFNMEVERQFLRECCPLTRSGNQYKFIHKSLLEYFMSRAVSDTQDDGNTIHAVSEPALQRRGGGHYTSSFEMPIDIEIPLAYIEQAVSNSPLWKTNLVGETSILQFLAERVPQNSLFRQQLLAMIKHSKVDKEARRAAANAITILVRAGESFDGSDLQGIQIPGADLSWGQLDSAQLQGADLRNTNLRNICLQRADLSNAQMSGVQFGEWPYLEEDDSVSSCVYSPDGRMLAVGLESGNICVYNTSTWVKLYSMCGHNSPVMRVAYSPNGLQIASGSVDKTVRLWYAQTGAPGLILRGHTDRVNSVAYSPDGQRISSGSYDDTVRLWDAQTGALGLLLRGHTDRVTSVAYSPNGLQIASGSFDKTVRLWDAQTGATGHILNGHTGFVISVAYSPNGLQIASGSFDKTVRLWEAQIGTSGPILSGHTDSVYSVAYSPNGLQIASGSNDSTVRLWDVQTGALGPILNGHISSITSVAYSPDGLQIASGSLDMKVRLWEAQIRTSSPNINGHTSMVLSVAYSPSGNQIASGSYDNTVRLWKAQTGAPGLILSGHSFVNSVAYSPNGLQIASGGRDFTVRLWDAHTGAPGSILSGHTDVVWSVAYSPDSLQIASGSDDETVRLWDAQTGAPGSILSGHTGYINSVAYSPDGLQIASGSHDKTVRLWDAQTGVLGPILSGHTGLVNSVAYSPNGLQIASGSGDKTVRLWDAQTGAPCLIFSGHTRAVFTVAYSPNGLQIASGSDDRTVRLWDVDSGQCLRVVNEFEDTVKCIAWNSTPSGTYLATGTSNVIREWQVEEDLDHHPPRQLWMSMYNSLSSFRACIQNVEGLSEINERLLIQRGALLEIDTLD